MGVDYLWDTNTVIYYLQQQFTTSAEKFIDSILPDSQPAISVITEIELLSWKTPTDEDLKILHAFVADAFVFELEKEIKQKTADLRKTYKIKLPDAIAATALVYDITLITHNTRDFDFIPRLKIVDPYSSKKI